MRLDEQAFMPGFPGEHYPNRAHAVTAGVFVTVDDVERSSSAQLHRSSSATSGTRS
jgi:hypothetical protein